MVSYVTVGITESIMNADEMQFDDADLHHSRGL